MIVLIYSGDNQPPNKQQSENHLPQGAEVLLLTQFT